MYDNNNVFAKILRGEIPCKKVYENEDFLCFPDINPQDEVHLLLIPKKPYENPRKFFETATPDEIKNLFDVAHKIIKEQNLAEPAKLLLWGADVPHLHLHIMGKKNK